MKIEHEDNKIIIYLHNETIDINNIPELNKKIKSIFIRIMKRRNYDFFGYNKVTVYHNDNYGIILEVEKIFSNEFNYQTIDLKIIVYKNVLMYFEFDDNYFDNIKEIKYNNGKYYLEIKKGMDTNKYIEYGRIKYKKITK